MEKKKVPNNHGMKHEGPLENETAEKQVSGNLIEHKEKIFSLDLLDLEGKIRFAENYDYKSMRKRALPF